MISYVKSNKYSINIKGIFKGYNPSTNELIIDDAKNGKMTFSLSDLNSFLDKEINFSFANTESYSE